MGAEDAARLDNCNLTFDSDNFTRPIRGRGMVALTSPSHWGVEAEGWVFRFEISGRAWSSVLASQLNFVRVEDVTAQTDDRKRMVAQWRKTSWPNERSAFCRLTIDSRHVPQFYQALSRAKVDATRAEARAAEADEQQRVESDATWAEWERTRPERQRQAAEAERSQRSEAAERLDAKWAEWERTRPERQQQAAANDTRGRYVDSGFPPPSPDSRRADDSILPPPLPPTSAPQ